MHLFRKIFHKAMKISNWLLLVFSVLFIGAATLISFALEPNNFKTMFNAFWWVMTTVTTVGYGDYYPHTVAGKWVGMFLYIFGISLIGIVLGKIMDAFYVVKKNREEGRLNFKGNDHFVIIGWNKNAELAVQEILHSDSNKEIVIIDLLEKTPFDHARVHYVQGNPTKVETMQQGNLEEAKAVFLFSNPFTENHRYIIDTSFIDGKTLLIAASIKHYFPKLYTIVEIVEEQNIHNFELVQVDEYILAEEMVSKLAVRSAFSPGASNIFSQLMSSKVGDDLYELKKRPAWNTYRDAFDALLSEGATLISDGQKLDINRRLDQRIEENARLFVICDKSTYTRIVGND